ncbi:MAG TPA: isopentenyl-diphosphate Delta-isomerase [Kineosporiaceae bacterium]|nr:isopentenyl-diphosphate Delta-isomerase [Kineosporiaceae bacterium]
MTDELVVLLDDDLRPASSAAKQVVHSASTPLHLAFSCYVTDAAGRLLMTRRALTKTAWPGVWTNSCCGHPAPDEQIAAAVRRRVRHELGLAISQLRCVLPDFRYRATDPGGVVENEVCPVFVALAVGEPDPDPTEVMDWRWADWSAVASLARGAPWALSPWCVLQLGQLPER